MKRHIEHGSALVIAVVVVVIISVLAVGLIRMGTLETAGAVAGAKREALSQCAEAATNLLLSKFHLLGVQPADITPINVALDGPNGRTWARSGHFDSVDIVQVAALPLKAAGPVKQSDDTNVIRTPGTTKAPLRVTVHCQDNGTPGDPTSGRQLEVELGIRFGM